MIFLRQLWNRKPDLWGPQWAVQSNVRHVSENMFGHAAPVLYLPMWKGGEIAYGYDASNGLNAVLKNSAAFVCDGVAVNGTTDYAEVNTTLITAGAMTVFYRSTGASNTVSISGVGSFKSISAGFVLGPDDGDRVGFFMNGTAKSVIATGLSIADGAEHSMVGVYSPSTSMSVYVDGEHELTDTTGVPASQVAGNPLRIGERGDLSKYFNGVFHSVGICDFAFTADQVAAHHEQPYAEIQRVARPSYFFVAGAGGTTYTLTAAAGSAVVTGTAASLLKDSIIVAVNGSMIITGTTADLLKNSMVAAGAGTVGVTGTAADLLKNSKLTAGVGAADIIGTAADLLKNSKLSADTGTCAITGQDIALILHRVLSADVSSIIATGTDVSLLKHSKLSTAVGTCLITGADVGLTYNTLTGHTLEAASGSFTITGSDTGLYCHRKLAIEPGTVTLAGYAAALLLLRVISADAGTLTIAGQDTTLLKDSRLSAGDGSIVLSGQEAALLVNRIISAGTGGYTVTGTEADLLKLYNLSASSGSITLSGQAVTLTYSGYTLPSGEVTITFSIKQSTMTPAVKQSTTTFTM